MTWLKSWIQAMSGFQVGQELNRDISQKTESTSDLATEVAKSLLDKGANSGSD